MTEERGVVGNEVGEWRAGALDSSRGIGMGGKGGGLGGRGFVSLTEGMGNS